MRLEATEIGGVFRVIAEPRGDARGRFARLFDPATFADAGVRDFELVQTNLSENTAARTLRGMHFQDPPFAEAKLVQVLRGAIFDVAIDLRPDSPTYTRWTAARLDAQSLRGLYVPEGCAHGFLTLEPDTAVLYGMGRAYVPGKGRGVRWNDPAFGVEWPGEPDVIAERDATYPDFTP